MRAVRSFDLRGRHAVLATMHGKEAVIAPVLESALGLVVWVPEAFDTDRFGTFSGEIARKGSQRDAACSKLGAALDLMPEASIGIASEGSFGPHPHIPFLAVGREIVVLHDREAGLEITGHDLDLSPNYDEALVEDAASAIRFAKRVGFPAQGVIVIGTSDGAPDPRRYLCKSASSEEHLATAVRAAVGSSGGAHVATDMRAHRNPTRMVSIRRATEDLVNRYRSACPACRRPGFSPERTLSGLPCAWCGEPTLAARAEIEACAGCGFTREVPAASATADPGACPRCNP